MYDIKNRELRWNATYSDYASTLPDDDDSKYSTSRHLHIFPVTRMRAKRMLGSGILNILHLGTVQMALAMSLIFFQYYHTML